jgi:hypothetical protein
MEIDFGCHPNFCGKDTSPRYSASKYLDLAPLGACLACEADPELSSRDGSHTDKIRIACWSGSQARHAPRGSYLESPTSALASLR